MPSLFTVTTNADNGNNGSPTIGSLRQAILESDAATPGPNTIDFDIGSGAETISPPTPLPNITVPVKIDGTSQPGYSGTPLIDIDGSSAGAGANGLALAAGSSGSQILGLMIENFNFYGIDVTSSNNTIGGGTQIPANVISGNGIGIGDTAGSNLIEGNFIGTDVTGTAAVGNFGDAVFVYGTALADTIGGTSTGAGNLISGNDGSGIVLTNAGNLVQGNRIGTNADGTAAISNTGAGIAITHASGVSPNSNAIGGTGTGAGNVISGNGRWGSLSAELCFDLISGNFIGTNAAGTAAIPNARGGILTLGELPNGVEDASDITIGGTTAGARNIISGNDSFGVEIDAHSNHLVVEGNYIGINADGTAAIPNTGDGLAITSRNREVGTSSGPANSNVIGGTGAGAGNVISGNAGAGIFLSHTTLDIVAGNFIGTNAAGTAALANAVGIDIAGNANTVGGTTTAAANVVSGNSNQGIEIFGGSNVIAGNLIGTDAAGTAALANAVGVAIAGNANTVGGTTARANVVSGNADDGIVIYGDSNLIAGNFIGTDADGTAAIPNAGTGVRITGELGMTPRYANSNVIGGTGAGAGNVISGNGRAGVYISVGLLDIVAGNFIGTDAKGTAAVPNGSTGVRSLGAKSIRIGGTAAGARNVISGDTYGIFLRQGTLDIVTGNFIGTDAKGTAAIPTCAHGHLHRDRVGERNRRRGRRRGQPDLGQRQEWGLSLLRHARRRRRESRRDRCCRHHRHPQWERDHRQRQGGTDDRRYDASGAQCHLRKCRRRRRTRWRHQLGRRGRELHRRRRRRRRCDGQRGLRRRRGNRVQHQHDRRPDRDAGHRRWQRHLGQHRRWGRDHRQRHDRQRRRRGFHRHRHHRDRRHRQRHRRRGNRHQCLGQHDRRHDRHAGNGRRQRHLRQHGRWRRDRRLGDVRQCRGR